MEHLIFGYGSLINRHSLARTVGRTPAVQELVPAWLAGYERVWDYAAQVCFEGTDEPRTAVFLNLRASAGARVNGIVLRVHDNELALLKARERFYDLVDVTAGIDKRFDAPVRTFVCTDPQHLARENAEGCVAESYLRIVRDGCEAQGASFTGSFDRTTLPIPFRLVANAYRFVP